MKKSVNFQINTIKSAEKKCGEKKKMNYIKMLLIKTKQSS